MTSTNPPTYTACSCSFSPSCFCAGSAQIVQAPLKSPIKPGELLIPGHLKTTERVFTSGGGRQYHVGVFIDNNGMEWEVVSPEIGMELYEIDGGLGSDDDDQVPTTSRHRTASSDFPAHLSNRDGYAEIAL